MTNYSGQHASTDARYEFSERLRAESIEALRPDAKLKQVLDIKSRLAAIVCEQASIHFDPHQSLFFLGKIHEVHPTVPNPEHDNIVGIAWRVGGSHPELGMRMLGCVGYTRDSLTTDGK